MIDPFGAPLVLLALIAVALVARDMRSLSNLRGFFDAAEQVLDSEQEAATVSDDIAEMARSILSSGLTRRMAVLAWRGVLTKELRDPRPQVRQFAERWRAPPGTPSRAAGVEIPRRFVWELTRSSLLFGSLFGVWLLWRRAAGALDPDGDMREWAVLAAVGVGVRIDERR